jgi:hypothetical protein
MGANVNILTEPFTLDADFLAALDEFAREDELLRRRFYANGGFAIADSLWHCERD